MSLAGLPALMTAEELYALPDDGVDRELIRGELLEDPMTRRNPNHSGVETRFAQCLANWSDTQPEPRGRVYSGEASFRLRRGPDSIVGIDVAYAPAGLPTVKLPGQGAAFLDGLPILAVEIVSPSDTYERVATKVLEYLDCGVPLVWVADPTFRTILAYRPDREPELFHALMDLTAEPQLPGFRVAVARIFDA